VAATGDETTAAGGHVTRELLDDYFVGRRSLSELGERAIGHVMERCAICRGRLEDADWSSLFRESAEEAEARLRSEQDQLAELIVDLLRLGRTETLVRVTSDPRYATLAFVRHQVDIASMAYEQGEVEVAAEANQLAGLVARRLDPGRYGREAIAWGEAERCLLQARLKAVSGDIAGARSLYRSGRQEVAAAGRPPSLLALQYLTGAEVRLSAGQIQQARVLARAAADVDAEQGLDHLTWSIVRVAARLDRLRGEPEAAVERLRRLFEGKKAPAGALEWSVARELIFALLEADELPEAVGWVAAWWGARCEVVLVEDRGGDDPGGEERVARGWAALGSEAPELAVLLGGLMRRQGRLREARCLLEEGRRELLRQRRGVEAVEATVELLRVLEALGETDRMKEAVVRLDELAECPDVSRRVVQALARYGGALWRGRVGDLDGVERAVLVHLGAPIDHLPHGPE
jgi:hypothetical protein